VVEDIGGDLMGSPSWGPDGSIVYAAMSSNWNGLYRASAEGGPAERLLGAESFPGHPFLAWPRHLPGDQRLLVLAGAGRDIGRVSFLFDPSSGERQLVAGVTSRAVAAAGDLFFAREGRVFRQTFDSSAGRLVGEPSIVAESVARNIPTGNASFDATANLLVTIDSHRWRRMQWFSLDGTPGEVLGEPGGLASARISPSGDRVVVARAENPGVDWDLWVFELERGTSTRVTSTPHREGRPVWSPDGEHLAYYTDATGPPDVRIRRAGPDGEERTVVEVGVTFPSDWSPDGRHVAFHTYPESDIHLVTLESGESTPWLEAPGLQRAARFSPGGEWIAFTSTELGDSQVFFAPLEDSARRKRVSVAEGWNPVWSPAGDAILYHDDRELRRVRVDLSSGRVEGLPSVVLRVESPERIEEFDLMPDGSRILVTLQDEDRLRPRTTVQVGWRAESR
jgi:Tol biopolymer transport system component